ncbi:hypothetical protein A2641_02350 [Candidatus Nomurabacteria bacterium RIFCSPHIGHO2_01_FULL_37_25]|uniref:Uncharacterized protein n=1 Tax=Candidatus Nomurabacteria bacterium RIFCSPLOWO2_01_FULL_36_16 TaxID=1801767 RepID=A0A1F6WY14_9BACT|nr:MAG: hypothetical protein A2641_02350 [Candidatus Nomurabacteria bacterium RIFCSPHIGHO2_01_FULL_37_25]OGI75828.1 MAG: hypothetical protein A3D36_00510 [Candidatus Nomurabacteria bacterium RIFCSPHIGHO2_02_FULL_36_29]OGI86768.1 MAG: hypothetical protein A3A91_02065 [Candidatus Nomurabacteria bacterium RIFCSPLOWO2_01_FULL_36_16]
MSEKLINGHFIEKEDGTKPETEKTKLLFPDNPNDISRHENILKLIENCPEEFFDNQNPWVRYANRIILGIGGYEKFEWRSKDTKIQEKQLACFRRVVYWGVKYELKETIAGWMLSEMLTTYPDNLE